MRSEELSHGTFPGGVMRRADLRDRGWSDARITASVEGGQLRRVRRGWFATPQASPEVVRAVRLGGAMTCVSALRWHRVWTPVGQRLHVRRSDALARGRLPEGVVECRSGHHRPVTSAVDPPRDAWRRALRCARPDEAVAVTDSALRAGLITPADLADLRGALRRVARDADPSAESGTESLVRVRLRRLGIRVRTQVVVPGVGRVDLLVGDSLVIECDSRAHHTGQAEYWNDRRRDRLLVVGGYLVLRLTWEDVMFHWDEILTDILGLVRAGRHLS